MKTESLDREILINAIWKSRGKVAIIAEQLGVTTRTIYNYAERYATVKQAIADAQGHMSTLMVDTAETKTFHGVINGERWAVLHVLNNSPEAKRRGWGGLVDSEGKTAPAIQFIRINRTHDDGDEDTPTL